MTKINYQAIMANSPFMPRMAIAYSEETKNDLPALQK